jgi:hypothetical protein
VPTRVSQRGDGGTLLREVTTVCDACEKHDGAAASAISLVVAEPGFGAGRMRGAGWPSWIADELRTVFAANRDGPMAGMVRFLPNNRLKAVLVITPQREYLARAEDWVRKRQFYAYAVQNRRAQHLLSALQALFLGGKATAGVRAT